MSHREMHFLRNTSKDIIPHIIAYYAWESEIDRTKLYYTTSMSPQIGDIIYNSSFVDSGEKVASYNQTNSYISDDNSDHYYRSSDTSKDIIPQPATLYTDSTTLTTGMTLYDNTGTDTGYKVGEISGNSFDIQSTVTNRSKLLLQNGNQSEVFNPQKSQIILSSLFAWLDDRGIEHPSIEEISSFYGQFPSMVVANVIFNELSANRSMSNCLDHVNIAFLTNFDLSNYDMMPISFFINDVNAVDLSFYSEEFAINARNSLFNGEEDIHLKDIGGLFVDNITSNYGFNLSAFETSAFDTTGTLIASDLGTIPDEFRYLFSSWFDDEASQITTIDNFVIKIPFMQGVNP